MLITQDLRYSIYDFLKIRVTVLHYVYWYLIFIFCFITFLFYQNGFLCHLSQQLKCFESADAAVVATLWWGCSCHRHRLGPRARCASGSGVYRPPKIRITSALKPVPVWERQTMIKYGIGNIRDLFGHKVDITRKAVDQCHKIACPHRNTGIHFQGVAFCAGEHAIRHYSFTQTTAACRFYWLCWLSSSSSRNWVCTADRWAYLWFK